MAKRHPTIATASDPAERPDKGHALPYFDVYLPYPPTFNSGWRCLAARMAGRTVARMVLSKRQRVFRKVVAQRVKTLMAEDGTPYRLMAARTLVVEITVHPPTRRRYDLDNLAKPVLDALMAAGVFEDDSQVAVLALSKGTLDTPTGSCFVSITAHPNTLAELQG